MLLSPGSVPSMPSRCQGATRTNMAEAEVVEEKAEEVVEEKPKKKAKKEVVAEEVKVNPVGPKTESMQTMPEKSGRRMKTMADRNRL